MMPRRFEEAVEVVGSYLERHGGAADRAAYGRSVALRTAFASWCDRLEDAPAPSSLDHNDLHPWNIFATNDTGTDRWKFYDWGDSVVAHPFSSMLVALGYLREHLDVSDDDPRILRARDAYLEVFDDLAPRADLVEALELACHVGKVARVLTWDQG